MPPAMRSTAAVPIRYLLNAESSDSTAGSG
jgi:hypothetical protein